MKKVKLAEVLKKNFYIKKVNKLSVAGKKQSPVLVKYPGNVWYPSGIVADIPDGKKVHRFRIIDDKLEFTFIGEPLEFMNSCICARAYTYDNKIILPQGLGGGYVVLTF